MIESIKTIEDSDIILTETIIGQGNFASVKKGIGLCFSKFLVYRLIQMFLELLQRQLITAFDTVLFKTTLIGNKTWILLILAL